MNKHQSVVQGRGFAPFPQFTGERVYMRRFTKQEGLPEDLKRWQPTIDAMLDGVETNWPIYMMVDQAFVPAGQPHRRPGKHIDGYWDESIQAHGGHRMGCWKGGGWSMGDFSEPEALILSSDVQAARAYAGSWAGSIADGGDCSTVDVSSLSPIDMLAGRVYAGNVTMIHESLPVARDCQRTLVRLSVPGWTP